MLRSKGFHTPRELAGCAADGCDQGWQSPHWCAPCRRTPHAGGHTRVVLDGAHLRRVHVHHMHAPTQPLCCSRCGCPRLERGRRTNSPESPRPSSTRAAPAPRRSTARSDHACVLLWCVSTFADGGHRSTHHLHRVVLSPHAGRLGIRCALPPLLCQARQESFERAAGARVSHACAYAVHSHACIVSASTPCARPAALAHTHRPQGSSSETQPGRTRGPAAQPCGTLQRRCSAC